MASRQPLLVIAGPTGVGKTRVGIERARALGGELIGADSVQVYRGFDIGSCKPTAAELGGLRHHLIDVLEPADAIDAAAYAALADRTIAEVRARGALPIVVGGTGLWLRALLRGLVGTPKVDRALRRALQARWDTEGALALHARLSEVDPLSAAAIHVNDKLRVVRALEVYEQTGTALGELRKKHALGAPRYDDVTLVLDLEPAHYRERIEQRTRAMLRAGFEREVRDLVAQYGADLKPLRSVGYREMVAHITGGVPLAETERAITRATLTYARRQRTWWKSDPSVRLRLTPAQALSPDGRAQLAALLRRPT